MLDKAKDTFAADGDEVSAVIITGDFIEHSLCYVGDGGYKPCGSGLIKDGKVKLLHELWTLTNLKV